MLVHAPGDMGGFGEEGAGFFEGEAIGALGAVGVDLLDGGEELGLVGVDALFGGDLLPAFPTDE